MSSYTTLVNVDADAATKLCHFISLNISDKEERTAFVDDCFSFVEQLKTEELINKVLSKKDIIFGLERESEATGCFEALFSLIYAQGENMGSPNITRSIISTLIVDTSTKPTLCLKALVALFNLTFNTDSKLEVLNAMFNYALKTGQSAQVSHLTKKYDDWVSSWNMSLEQQRALLKSLALVLQDSGDTLQALTIMIKFFKTFQGEGNYPKDVEELISATLLSAIKSPIAAFSERVTLLESLNTSALTGTVASLAKLLQIISDGSLNDFKEFMASSSGIFKTYNIDEEQMDQQMRLLSLCSLAATSVGKPIGFDSIIEACGCTDDMDVEVWVIEAISQGLIEASIDQVRRSVHVTKYAHRSFGKQDWLMLQKQLMQLRRNIGSCVDTINKSKIPML